jgi:hypothetical protein
MLEKRSSCRVAAEVHFASAACPRAPLVASLSYSRQRLNVTPAKRIANAIARSGLYHKRTAVLSALIALGCCIAVFVLDRTVEKALALSFAVIFGLSAFRSLRRANRYFGLEGSPVLEAITQAPHHIRSVRPSVQGGAPAVVVSDIDDNELSLRVGPGEGAMVELLEAFRHHAPRAKVEDPPARGQAAGKTPASTMERTDADEDDSVSTGSEGAAVASDSARGGDGERPSPAIAPERELRNDPVSSPRASRDG